MKHYWRRFLLWLGLLAGTEIDSDYYHLVAVINGPVKKCWDDAERRKVTRP